MIACRQKKVRRGEALDNRNISNLPVELHIPGFQFCGPSTKLQKSSNRDNRGIDPLHSACNEHDKAYPQNRDNLDTKHPGDQILSKRASKRVFAKDASLANRAAAWHIANTRRDKIKRKMGIKQRMSHKTSKKLGKGMKEKKLGKGMKKKKIALDRVIQAAEASTRLEIRTGKFALKGARDQVKLRGAAKTGTLLLILPSLEKIDGVLPVLIPLFAGFRAIGALVVLLD